MQRKERVRKEEAGEKKEFLSPCATIKNLFKINLLFMKV
jgi:hypothetical protein